ncbi:MAG: YgfZ/GcvT domain-containing protein [Pseudomonadota bacterium]
MKIAASTTFSRLPHLGVLAIDGADALTFLQGQATCDCRQLSATRGALGALCNLQGRMIVSFYVLAVADGLQLVMPRDRIAAILTHLKKYAVFSRVTLRDECESLIVLGMPAADAAFTAEPFTITAQDDIFCLQLRAQRVLGLAPVARFASAIDGSDAWRAAAIAAGELLIDTANADRLLPQALNYDVIDGVSFNKGCYTGQEIVARMHFKGKMKERLRIASANVAAAPGANTAIVNADDKPVGEVIDAVVSERHCTLAAVIRHDAARTGNLHLGDAQGAPIVLHAMPYLLPDAG